MDMIGKIRRMHRRDKKTTREISRATGRSRNTVATWLDEAQPVEPKYRREAAMATKLSAHEAEFKQALKADSKRPKKERRTAKATRCCSMRTPAALQRWVAWHAVASTTT